MFGLADRGNKNKENSVWVMFWYTGLGPGSDADLFISRT